MDTSFSSWASIWARTCGRAAGDDGDAAGVGVAVGLGDRQALDVVAAGGEQADDAVQDARLVVHEDGERRQGLGLDGVAHVVGRGGGVSRHRRQQFS